MSNFGPKTSKAEASDKTPYTIYYPHRISHTNRKWNTGYYQVVSIDPARKNYALRIERRHDNGNIIPLVFDKASIEDILEDNGNTICNTYQVLTEFLDKYKEFYDECHFIIIERQLPQNYKATRIAQHSISYFSIYLNNKPLLPCIVEIDPKLKGKYLGAPKQITDRQLKCWSVEKARELLTIRKDGFSLKVLDQFKKKQDDLADTVCQIEALFICWGLPITDTKAVPKELNIIETIPDKPLSCHVASQQISKLVEAAPSRDTSWMNIIKTPVTLNITVTTPFVRPEPKGIEGEDYFVIPTKGLFKDK